MNVTRRRCGVCATVAPSVNVPLIYYILTHSLTYVLVYDCSRPTKLVTYKLKIILLKVFDVLGGV